jgi:sulfur carrier protein
VKVTVNGAPRDLLDDMTVGALLEMLGSPSSGIAVARNERVVRRSDYDSDCVREGDRIEIITAVAGG